VGPVYAPPGLDRATPADGAAGAPHASPSSPRAAALLHLIDDMRAALVGGDREAALLLHETVGALLRAPSPASALEVVDLGAERRRRAGG